jgi:cobalt-zinc-cadmium efflux system outer membrane protein
MIRCIKKYIWAGIFLMTGLPVMGQTDTAFLRAPLTYPSYLLEVGRHNLGYSAEKFNLDLAAANIEMAKVFPDPELGFGWSDNGERRMKSGYGFNSSLGYSLELGGKRSARIHLAGSQAEMTKALLEDYFRNLRADATLAYLQAMQLKNLYDVKLSSYDKVNRLAISDSIRFKLGAIMENDARQSKLEAGSILNEVYQSEADWKVALLNLGLLLGKQPGDTLYDPAGSFDKFERSFSLPVLITAAQSNRADLVAALKSQEVSLNMLKLAKANRMIDLGLSLGVTSNSVARNVVAPTPSSNVVAAGISMPLKFSNKYKGELKAAAAGIKQAEVQYTAVLLQIQTEVMQAYFNYLAAGKQVQQFNSGLMSQAQKVLEGKVYSYNRGETSLLEVLNAQRTYNEVQENYYQTLYNHAAALVELERASGIWDINF